MDERRLIFAVCLSGPYKHVHDLVVRDREHAWFPWGYTTHQMTDEARSAVRPGAVAELWEVDDTRSPNHAEPLSLVVIDHINRTADYFAMTLRRTEGTVRGAEQDVVSVTQAGMLAFVAG